MASQSKRSWNFSANYVCQPLDPASFSVQLKVYTSEKIFLIKFYGRNFANSFDTNCYLCLSIRYNVCRNENWISRKSIILHRKPFWQFFHYVFTEIFSLHSTRPSLDNNLLVIWFFQCECICEMKFYGNHQYFLSSSKRSFSVTSHWWKALPRRIDFLWKTRITDKKTNTTMQFNFQFSHESHHFPFTAFIFPFSRH